MTSRPDLHNAEWPGHWPVDRLSTLLSSLERSLLSSSATSESLSLLQQARTLTDGFDPYLSSRSTAVPPLVAEMVLATDREDWESLHSSGKTRFALSSAMCAGTYEASVLRVFAGMVQAASVLEIGMFTGTSTLAVSLLPHVKKVVALEVEEYLKEWTRPWFEKAGVQDKIDVRIGDANQSLENLQGQSFDLIFIDADKVSYPAYFRHIISHRLLSPKGVLILDNTLYKGSPWCPHRLFEDAVGAIEEVNKAVVASDQVEAVLLPIRDGVTLVRWKS